MLENGYSEEDGVVKKADRTVERLMKKRRHFRYELLWQLHW